MTHEEMQELAKAAAHSAVVAKYSTQGAWEVKFAVDSFLDAYEYSMKKLYEKQQQAQAEANKYKPPTSEDYINGGRSL